MIRSNSIIALFLPIVSSCFINDTQGNRNPQSGKPDVQGVVIIHDITRAEPLAYFLAGFWEKGDSTIKASLRRYFGDPSSASERGPECQTYKKPLQPKRASSQYISAGKVTFGIEGQSSLITASEGEDHLYLKQLKAGVPSGLYRIKVDGNDLLDGFSAQLSMPEELKEVKINGEDPLGAAIRIRKNEDLKVEWKSPSFDHEGNRIIVSLIASTASEEIEVYCSGKESENTWEIPSSSLDPLLIGELSLRVIRAHAFRATQERIEVVFEGARRVSATATLE